MSNTITLTTCISFRRGGSYNSLWFIALTLPYIRVQWSPGQACAGCWVSRESLSLSQDLHKLLTGETHHSFISAQGGQGGTTFLVSLVSNFFVRIVFQWQQKYYMTIKNYANFLVFYSACPSMAGLIYSGSDFIWIKIQFQCLIPCRIITWNSKLYN